MSFQISVANNLNVLFYRRSRHSSWSYKFLRSRHHVRVLPSDSGKAEFKKLYVVEEIYYAVANRKSKCTIPLLALLVTKEL